MASTLFNRLSPQGTMPQAAGGTPVGTINNLANQILTAVNPQQQFNNMVAGNKDAQNAMNIINQYGNGDPKAAFLNYASQMGKDSLAKSIMSRLGLG